MKRSGATHSFWHDERLPFLEVRAAGDGRNACYDRHSHETFSIGTINAGRSSYFNTNRETQVAKGNVTVMNPGEVHACNPIGRSVWSYRMFYIDVDWLARIQRGNGSRAGMDFGPYAQMVSDDPHLFRALNNLFEIVTNPEEEVFAKEVAAVECFASVDELLERRLTPSIPGNPRIKLAADYISDNWSTRLALSDICLAAGLSPTLLIRGFKQHYGTTPYTYLVNRRIQVARRLIRNGWSVVDAGLETQFYDQSHFHKAFKRFTAATPGEYARAVASCTRPDKVEGTQG